MSQQERLARLYCASIGADADETVIGFQRDRWGFLEKIEAPRWKWYVGAMP